MNARKIRVTHPGGLFLGEAHHRVGTVVDVPDDRRARQLVELGHCEFVAQVAGLDPHVEAVERGTRPRPPEKAARR